eukprot:SM000260S09946  [mRNA]  locus=s260:94241:96342:- [translate_table: standard]
MGADEACCCTFLQVPAAQYEAYQWPHQEQTYGPDLGIGSNLAPAPGELNSIAAAAARLWALDANRLVPGRDYEIDAGGGKKVYQRGADFGGASLFRYVNPAVFARPTYARFFALLDNYNPDDSITELDTAANREEQRAFIEEAWGTPPVQYLYHYLAAKGLAPQDPGQFKAMLLRLWFALYGRNGGMRSSCAFEHVFVGEIKQGEHGKEVNGFHNWIQFYIEESRGRVDYRGFILPRRHSQPLPDSQSQLLTIQFAWLGTMKDVSSTLVGVSPEFELALYTLCFAAGAEDNHLRLGPYAVNVKVYRLDRDRLGSAFVIAKD